MRKTKHTLFHEHNAYMYIETEIHFKNKYI